MEVSNYEVVDCYGSTHIIRASYYSSEADGVVNFVIFDKTENSHKYTTVASFKNWSSIVKR